MLALRKPVRSQKNCFQTDRLPLLVLDRLISPAQMGEGLIGGLEEQDGNGGTHVLDVDH